MGKPKADREWVEQWGELRSAKGWWHSFELPDGTRIDGVHDVKVLEQRIAQFPIPNNLRGQRVLDIGAWDGWYSFEMERRGAEVMAIDNWDNPRFHQIHAMLGSQVEYRQMDIYELTPERVGRFDIVLFMGVLYHLKHPLLALERVCALTTGMAAVESFVVRDSHRPGENVDERPIMEFYETNEFGGQTDNWVGPSTPCLLALCRTAGFARVELQRVMDYGVSVACYRKWVPPSPAAGNAPRLVQVAHNTKGGIHFDSRHDEYVSAWFTCREEALALDDVKPEAGGYGVRPIHVARVEDGSWQANFKLPPGLTAGWHSVQVRIGDSLPSNARQISIDVPSNAMNVQKVISQIHARVQKEAGVESVSLCDSSELTALRSAYQRLYQNRNAVGKIPPAPNTLRARIGGYVVRGVQRCLFWYTPQILQFQNDAVSLLDCACNLIGRESQRTTALEQEAHKLRREISKLKGDVVRPADSVKPGLPNSFEFALQDRFRGPETETSEKLQVYLETLKSLLPTVPRAQWLDIGCGRGEWLEAVSKLGYSILGVDSNPVSVARCRAKGLNAEERDALTYLQSLDDGSAAVVTAFQVVEHWPMHYVLALVQEAVRVLKPGGLLIVETPNPANLLMGSTNFWNDPTHYHPIPLRLLEFVYEYFGLTLVERLDLNPDPNQERFPLDEFSVGHRLNGYFYGPQDYGLIGRR